MRSYPILPTEEPAVPATYLPRKPFRAKRQTSRHSTEWTPTSDTQTAIPAMFGYASRVCAKTRCASSDPRQTGCTRGDPCHHPARIGVRVPGTGLRSRLRTMFPQVAGRCASVGGCTRGDPCHRPARIGVRVPGKAPPATVPHAFAQVARFATSASGYASGDLCHRPARIRGCVPEDAERGEESGQGRHLAALQPPLRRQAAMTKRPYPGSSSDEGGGAERG